MTQLALELAPRPEPQVVGRLWCGDDARLGGQCWYSSHWISRDGEIIDRARFMPEGGCCKVLSGVACPVPWSEAA